MHRVSNFSKLFILCFLRLLVTPNGSSFACSPSRVAAQGGKSTGGKLSPVQLSYERMQEVIVTEAD